jgi:hypothetical protein
MGTLLAAITLSFCVQAGDKKDDPKPLAADVAAALQRTAKRGPFAVAGKLKTEINPDDADEEAVVCSVVGSVAPGERAVAEIKGDASTHELVLRRNRMAGRETWKGHPLDLINAPGELMSLLDLDRLALHVKDASSAKALPDEKAGGEDCGVTELSLPRTTIRSYHDEADAAEEEEKSVRGVTLKVRVRKSDGLVVSLDASVQRLYKDDAPAAGAGTKGVTAYSLGLKDFGTAEVVAPPGLEKFLKD